MTRESSTNVVKRERNNKKPDQKKKKHVESDSESDYDSESVSESENEDDIHEFRKYINKIFPSKHMKQKIVAGERLKKIANKYTKQAKTSKPKTKNRNRKPVISDEDYEEESYDDEDYETEDDDDDYETDDDEEEEEDEEEAEVENSIVKHHGSEKINIIFTIKERASKYADEDDDESVDYVTENEDDDVSTDDSSDETNSNSVPSPVKSIDSKSESGSNEVLETLKHILANNPKDKTIEKCIEMYEQNNKIERKKLDKKEKKQKEKNTRIFSKIMSDKNTMNDLSFYKKLELPVQKKLIKELKEINKTIRIEKPYRMTLLEANIPIQFKAAALKKVNSLKYMEPGSGEFYKIKNWVDTFMKIPFTACNDLPISIENGIEDCHLFMENAKKTLDDAVYGLCDAKMQIMQMIGQLLTNPKSIGTAIAIHGPPGTGKTSLVKEGISKILNRPFSFIALGGATDSSFLEGHGYTYEGSTWGKIVQILIDSKCMNPVIYFDELDKISDTPRGEEIVGILTHLTDTSQNSQFHDKYFAEINFDLSKCLFIFSYNDESKVNPILKDRMYRIKTKGYSCKEKTTIANNYLLPKIREQVKFNDADIIIPDDVVSYINETHCCKEDGVRNMKRCLEIIHTKLNLYRLMRPGTNIFESDMSLKVEFPFKVTKEIVDKLIKKETDGVDTWRSLYM